MPESSSGLSNVKRVEPETGSVPTLATIRPNMPAISPFSIDSPDNAAMTLRPRMPSAKYAAGVNASAIVDNRSVRRTSATRPTRPPMTPEYSEIPSASPARPCCFMA